MKRKYIYSYKKEEKGKQTFRGVVIREVNTRMNIDNLLILGSFKFCVVGKKKMVDDEQRSSDVSARPTYLFCEIVANNHYWEGR
jgi:hypothetical protein